MLSCRHVYLARNIHRFHNRRTHPRTMGCRRVLLRIGVVQRHRCACRVVDRASSSATDGDLCRADRHRRHCGIHGTSRSVRKPAPLRADCVILVAIDRLTGSFFGDARVGDIERPRLQRRRRHGHRVTRARRHEIKVVTAGRTRPSRPRMLLSQSKSTARSSFGSPQFSQITITVAPLVAIVEVDHVVIVSCGCSRRTAAVPMYQGSLVPWMR